MPREATLGRLESDGERAKRTQGILKFISRKKLALVFLHVKTQPWASLVV